MVSMLSLINHSLDGFPESCINLIQMDFTKGVVCIIIRNFLRARSECI